MRLWFVTSSTDFHTNTYFSRSGNRWLHLPKEYNLIHFYILLVTPSSQIHLQLIPLGKLKYSLRQQDWGLQERHTCIHKRSLPVLPCAGNCCKTCAATFPSKKGTEVVISDMYTLCSHFKEG